jgi:hypothetical protein
MEIARFIVMYVVFVLMFNFVEIINVVLIQLMMNVASVWRWMHNLTLHEYQIVCDIMFNNYYDAPVYRILEGLQDQTACKYYKNFDLLIKRLSFLFTRKSC